MEYFCDTSPLHSVGLPVKIISGSFDGVHIEHRKFVKEFTAAASAEGKKSILLSVNDDKDVLTTENEKALIFEKCGLDVLYSLSGNEVSGVKADAFEPIFMTELTHLIKKELKNGDIEKSSRHLGSNYSFFGKIIHGRGLGIKIGIPTANLDVPRNKFLPRYGVYASMVELGSKTYHAITNIGTRPTVDDSVRPTVETHLLNFDGNLYGVSITVVLYSYLREVKKFDNIDLLVSQVKSDSEKAEAFFKAMD